MYYKVYENKTDDNGLEFTDKFARGDKKSSGNHKFDKVMQRTRD